MKKRSLMFSLFLTVLFTGCSFNSPLNDEVVQGNKEVYANFSWTLISVWVWPIVTKELDASFTDLVLRWWSDDVLIHLFVPEEFYKKAFSSEEDYLPWNEIEIMGEVVEKNSYQWHRYYELKSAKTMKLVKYPDINDIGDILSSYWSCKEDSDCEIIWWINPLECFLSVNRNFTSVSMDILGLYDTRIWGSFSSPDLRDCHYPDSVMCRYNTCMVSYWNDNEIPYYDGPIEEKFALSCPTDLNDCNPDWWPVCSSDWVEYVSDCEACEALVSVYIQWGCN